MSIQARTLLLPLFSAALVCTSCVSGTESNNGPGTESTGSGGVAADPGTGGFGTGGNLPSGSGGSVDVSTGGTLEQPGAGGQGTGGQGTGGLGATGGASSGGQSGSGGTAAVGSDGCGTATASNLSSWVSSDVDGGRSYDVWLPENYDHDRAYPVILLLHGCGGKTNNVPLQDQTGADSILIRGTGSAMDACWDDTADLPYIDAMLADVKDRFCVNPDHIFAVGYSSGSWVASKLSCVRGDVFRGIATVTGGEPGGIQNCVGQVGRMFVHDTDDTNNRIEWDTPSRDRMVNTNNCQNSTAPVSPSPCVEYQGCDPGYPVVWCQTSGQGHGRQDGLAAPAFWDFFQSLMSP